MTALPREPERPRRSTLRWTLFGVLLGGALFGSLGVYRSMVGGGPLLRHLNPLGVVTVLGATVGGLLGPMLGGVVARIRSR